MINADRIFAAVMIVVALGYILSATTIQIPLFPDPLGPKAFPMLVAAGVILCSIVMLIRPDGDPEWPAAARMISLAIAAIVMIAYAYALKPMGFLIPTALAAGILSYQLKPQALKAALTGLGLSIGLFVLFKFALGLGLQAVPKGWF